jgi:hypothetical protein
MDDSPFGRVRLAGRIRYGRARSTTARAPLF